MLVSHKLSSFSARNMSFLPAAQFAYRKVLGCTDALQTISHLLQKYLDAGTESYIVQLDFSTAFDRVSHSGLLKLKSIIVGGIVRSICGEFLSNRRHRVVVDGAIIVSGSQSFLACLREVCWVHLCSSFIPVKCLRWWRTDFIPMLMTPHHWQLFASQQTDLLLLPPYNRDLLGFRSGAITGAGY